MSRWLKYGLYWNGAVLLLSLIGNLVVDEVYSDKSLHGAFPPLTNADTFHILGTDYFGVDLFSQLLTGFLYSFFSALGILVFSTFIALVLGVLSAYYGNHFARIRRLSKYVVLLVFCLNIFYVFVIQDTILLQLFSLLAGSFLILLDYKKFRTGYVKIPLDTWISRAIEWGTSLPKFLLLLTLVVFLNPNWLGFMVIIACLTWMYKARVIRAEVLKCKEELFIDAAKVLGFNDFWIMFKHILLNIYGSILVLIIYGLADLFLLDASLNFIGINAFGNVHTWGSILAQYKYDMTAWWLFFFPALGLILFILPLFLLAHQLENKQIEKIP